MSEFNNKEFTNRSSRDFQYKCYFLLNDACHTINIKKRMIFMATPPNACSQSLTHRLPHRSSNDGSRSSTPPPAPAALIAEIQTAQLARAARSSQNLPPVSATVLTETATPALPTPFVLPATSESPSAMDTQPKSVTLHLDEDTSHSSSPRQYKKPTPRAEHPLTKASICKNPPSSPSSLR